jgi:hypothetical protein
LSVNTYARIERHVWHQGARVEGTLFPLGKHDIRALRFCSGLIHS